MLNCIISGKKSIVSSLLVGCTGVAIYYKDDMGFEIFDSHARDLYAANIIISLWFIKESLSCESKLSQQFNGEWIRKNTRPWQRVNQKQ